MHTISCPGSRGRQVRTAKRRRAAVAATVIVPLLLAGCGGSSPTSTTAQDPGFQSVAAAAVKYSQCMREHGLPNFPDPKISSSPGHASIGIEAVGPDGGTPQFKVAQAACHSIMPGPSSSDLASQATQQHQHEQDILSFTRCLRSHGVANFPDPDAQGRLSPATVQAAGVDMHAPAFVAAAMACIPASHGAVTAAAIQQAESANP